MSHAKRLGPTSILAVASLVLPPLGSIALFTYMNPIGNWFRSHATEGIALYAIGFAVLSGLALLPTYASAVLGGWAFGFEVGFIASLFGFSGGALIGYHIAGLAAGDRVEQLFRERPNWLAVRNALLESGFLKTLLIVTLVRLPPNSPFAATNIVLGSLKVNRLAFVLGTLFGRAPRTGVVIYLAVQLRDQLASDAANRVPWWYWLVSMGIAGIAMAVLYQIGKRGLKRATGR